MTDPQYDGDSTDGASTDGDSAGIDSADLDTCLRVLKLAGALDKNHPDSIVVQRASGQLFKDLKRSRRIAARNAKSDADRAVVESTATGSPNRIDDETAGLSLTTRTSGEYAGTLIRARPCYICKQRYTLVDAFYHQLCPDCAELNRSKRDARTDLSGRRALLTGGRAKIGMYIALRLLRDGAHTTITTRFPGDAIRRFSAMDDSDTWLHRLRIVGIDLRDPAQVVALADSVAAEGPLDILINNAAQTVKRSPGSYSALIDAESEALPSGARPDVITFGKTSEAHPASLASSLPHSDTGAVSGEALSAEAVSSLALLAGSATAERIEKGIAIDAGGLVPDLADTNSWIHTVEQVDPVELLEVQLCNSVAPFILVSRLRAAMEASPARRKYVVNVSAMEGQFSRAYKGPGHPHTNMAKAALNMLTRTSAKEMLESGILMSAVDTGWITDERPHPTKMRLAGEGFHAPLDLVDGAARVYDPIVQGELGVDVHGQFLKDFSPSPW
ncbi:MAG: SDR family NAD(P)-dependent oxidoreductase [Rhodococcus sp. (in: high G+C Gram-positive bacteria)]|uniref:SDR family NAD(P)-dependent oxidoreductase n=1 Tax=Rhodococcus sp. EPR-157 TaxID=1813677 RepID=UPI0007BC479C|nr:SDR family NAD(P)-dependent oxidoreductase [Rhodococcus sp. EPR-157]KZF12986.1 short-chain dehydrogenase [Rhodococcus sp. EPR-157]